MSTVAAAYEFGDSLPVLQGARVVLRPPRLADAGSLLRAFGDPVAMRYWSHEPLPDLAAAQEYLRSCLENFAERRLFQWAIADRETDVLLGTTTLFDWRRDHRRIELGYILAPGHWGRGLAQEAVHQVLGFAFDTMGVHRVEADIDPRNTASKTLMRRIGFREEGVSRERWFTYGEWCDTAWFGLLASEYQRPLGESKGGR